MTMDAGELLQLAQSTSAERANINLGELQKLENEQLVVIAEAIAVIRHLLYLKGIMATDFYHCKSSDMAFTNEETSILPRVRWDARYGVPSFLWEKLIKRSIPIAEHEAQGFKKRPGVYISRARLKNGKLGGFVKVVMSGKTIALQKSTDSIAKSTFDNEPTWAQFAGESAERKLRQLRKQSKQVSSMSKHLSLLRDFLATERALR